MVGGDLIVGGETAVHDVAFEQDCRLAVVQEPLAVRLDLVDCIDRRQRQAEASSGGDEVGVLQQVRTVSAAEGGQCLRAGDAIGDQSMRALEGAHRVLGGGAEVAVLVEVGAGPGVQSTLKLADLLRTITISKGHADGLSRAATLPRERKISRHSRAATMACQILTGGR